MFFSFVTVGCPNESEPSSACTYLLPSKPPCGPSILRCNNPNIEAQCSYRNSAPNMAMPLLPQKAVITQIANHISLDITNSICTKLPPSLSRKTLQLADRAGPLGPTHSKTRRIALIHTAGPVFCKNRKIKQVCYSVPVRSGGNIRRRLVSEPETAHPGQISEIDVAVRLEKYPSDTCSYPIWPRSGPRLESRRRRCNVETSLWAWLRRGQP